MTQKRRFSCHSCGKEVECPSGAPPCEALQDWITVCHWKGQGAVSHYSFCSFSCLKSWAVDQAPSVPQIFLESFNQDKP